MDSDTPTVEKPRCQICGNAHSGQLNSAALIRPAVAELIRKETGKFDENGWICLDDLAKFRHLYMRKLLESERGEITGIEEEVINSLHEHDILTHNPEVEFESKLTLGQRLADRIASLGGSWRFISFFILVIIVWMIVNSILLRTRPFDPYPYILLNLVLSCLAALQAPVIMMSQNRGEARDRLHAAHDYQVNLKAELEIRQLHQKVDHILSSQWARLMEIQDIQLELMNELRRRR
ncbi:MAG: DUF1003 domain-containing protein [Gammaproteobacteria bacterium]